MNPNRIVLATALVALLALLALPTVPAQEDAGQERVHILYLHENPLHVAPEQINANVGDTVVLQVKNFNEAAHDLVVCGDAPDADSQCTDRWGYVSLGPQEEGTLRFVAKEPGTYEFYCTIPGHKQGGMSGELHVAGAASEEKKSVPAPATALALLALAGVAALRRAPRD